jgi:methionyl-tRNA synthetase
MPRYLVTSALPYANGPIHFGHVIGAYLPADVYTRYRRMCGDDVMFVCGTDEHGVAITINAEAQGVDYRAFVDRWHREIGDTLRAFGIEFGWRCPTNPDEFVELFSGTNRCQYHEKISQEFFTHLDKNGYLTKKAEKQWYCETHKMFLADRYLEGTCPFCGAENARGDECKVCGQWIDALELKNPRCKLCGTTPVVKETTHWYLDLPKLHADGLGAWFDGNDRHVPWKPNVKSFVGNMLKDLHPRPITRDLRWGVPVPLPDTDGKVLYVWFDAPIGYCSMTQELLNKRGKGESWLDWWSSPETRLLHFIGKDNIGFHTIVFPAMLFGQKTAFDKKPLTLPWAVPAMEFYNLQGRKFSTSDGWTIDPKEFLAKFPSVDAIRFTLLSTAPETADSEFTFEDYQRVNNRDLADNIGNLLSRNLKFGRQHFGEVVEKPASRGAETDEFMAFVTAHANEAVKAYEEFKFRDACGGVLSIARRANEYFDKQAPWAAVKSDATRDKARECVYWTCWALAHVALTLEPAAPDASRRILAALGFESAGALAKAAGFESAAQLLTRLHRGGDPSLTSIPAFRLSDPPILFQKIDDKTIAAEVAAFLAKSKPAQPAPSTPPVKSTVKPTAKPNMETPAVNPAPASPPPASDPNAAKAIIQYDDFAKIELRAGTILSAERVPKADKLLKLQVDIGREKRQIVAGIAAKYTPEELTNRRVVVVCNLAPKPLRGVESQGMVLAGDDGHGPVLVTPSADLANGATVK